MLEKLIETLKTLNISYSYNPRRKTLFVDVWESQFNDIEPLELELKEIAKNIYNGACFNFYELDDLKVEISVVLE